MSPLQWFSSVHSVTKICSIFWVLFCSSREDHEYWHQPHGPLRADCLHRTIPVPVDRPVPAHTSHPKRLCTHQNIAPPPPPLLFPTVVRWWGDGWVGRWVWLGWTWNGSSGRHRNSQLCRHQQCRTRQTVSCRLHLTAPPAYWLRSLLAAN